MNDLTNLPTSRETNPVVGVLGVGRLGRAFVRGFQEIGVSVQPRGRDAIASFHTWLAACDLVSICVRDDQIGSVVDDLARHNLAGKTILMHAGTIPLTCLDRLAEKGANIGKFHPLMSFSEGHEGGIPQGTPFAFEGPIRAVIEPWVSAWKAQLHRVEGAQWQAYHLAAVLSANFLPLFVRAGGEILQELTDGDLQAALNWLAPLVQKSVANGLAAGNPNPFSGPAVRGDDQVLVKQTQYLMEHKPEFATLYRAASAGIQKMALTINKNKKT